MKIGDLSLPMTAAKADWLAGTHWVGFTPTAASGAAREQCRAAISAQIDGGYIIEYITQKFGDPNPGFERDARCVAIELGRAAERHGHDERVALGIDFEAAPIGAPAPLQQAQYCPALRDCPRNCLQ